MRHHATNSVNILYYTVLRNVWTVTAILSYSLLEPKSLTYIDH
jgi:hypothetical protein